MKISRRALAQLALAQAAAPQTAPPQSDFTDEQALREVERNSEALRKHEVPMSLEPAFVFKP